MHLSIYLSVSCVRPLCFYLTSFFFSYYFIINWQCNRGDRHCCICQLCDCVFHRLCVPSNPCFYFEYYLTSHYLFSHPHSGKVQRVQFHCAVGDGRTPQRLIDWLISQTRICLRCVYFVCKVVFNSFMCKSFESFITSLCLFVCLLCLFVCVCNFAKHRWDMLNVLFSLHLQ